MKRFLTIAVIYAMFIAGTIWTVFLTAGGRTDPHYLHFTSPLQSSLIIGTSKAAQGLRPEFLNDALGRSDIYNFAFTIGHSPYGPSYLKLITKKLDPNARNGIFIVTVDPWSISSQSEDVNDISTFREANRYTSTMQKITGHPNTEFLLDHFGQQYYKILFPPSQNNILHEDGWLEITGVGGADVRARKLAQKVDVYRKRNLEEFRFSPIRLNYLGKTIELLQEKGKVFLVRLPVDCQIKDIENELIPDFDVRMQNLSTAYTIPYFNFVNSCKEYEYTDGNHLMQESGKHISQQLGELISAHFPS